MSASSPICIDYDSPLTSPDTSSDDNTVSKPVAPVGRTRKPFVSLPQISPERKRLYKPLNQISFGADLEARVDEVIGEYREGNTLYYFARYLSGIARKYLASTFIRKYGNLVNEYKKKKSEGSLAPFDPSAQYIHPLARVKLKIRISSDHMSQASRSAHSESIPGSENENSGSDEEDDEYGITRTRTQSKRPTRAKPGALPFSPRKTRARKLLVIRDSESCLTDDDSDNPPLSVRRSMRARKTTEIELDSDNDYVDTQTDGPIRRIKLLAPKKKVSRPRSVIHAYGRVRDIGTVDEDPFDNDDEKEILRLHRGLCEKCHEGPAHSLLATLKRSKGKGKKRKRDTDDEFEWSDVEEKFTSLGGWVQCLKCPVAAHWGCLASTQKDEILRNIRERDHEDLKEHDNQGSALLRKRMVLEVDQMTEFICGSCSRGGFCMGCMETVIQSDSLTHPKTDVDTFIKATSESISIVNPESAVARELFFRCFMCKRLAHYNHLPKSLGLEDASVSEIADHYQSAKQWLCADCSSFKYELDKIIAWRPYPPNASEPVRKPDEVPNHKHHLPREYLVKWKGRSYRRLDWVPHMWLASTKSSKLKNFIISGTRVDLLEEPVQSDQARLNVDTAMLPAIEEVEESRSSSVKPEAASRYPVGPMPDAEQRIPLPWKTVHRVLDVVLWRPNTRKRTTKRLTKRAIASSSEDDDPHVDYKRIVLQKGEQPGDELTMRVDDWEQHKPLEITDVKEVAWIFIKWDELGYEEACWDAPPQPDEIGFDSFKAAFQKFIESRKVLIPRRNKDSLEAFDKRVKDRYLKYMLKDAADLDLGQPQHLKLMPFQVDGFNWLCNNWWNRQHCILADEMGLGKTVQIVTFLGNITASWDASPSLVVVPNSTIMNWVREFERWAPNLRVVPFYGEKNARDVIKEFELFHSSAPPEKLGIKFHVLVTTYEAITSLKATSAIFKHPPRWEVLVVDEGQRLKSDSSLLFRKLSELNSSHRIIMTGTPLNNNIRELFNLMNFLDPEEWNDLEALEKQYQELDEELIKDLHTKLRPYFLRRVKSEVLELPPKNEVIVPVSMAPLQREVYRSILSNNLEILRGLTQPSAKQNAPARARINNVLMQLRKCLQHPYLYAEDIEPRNLAPNEAHEKLIDASAKLRFLKILLPKLKEGGHRVLLFSQFVIALNVIEDFLVGERYKFLRLDGNTKGSVRQKAMDEFNKPGSDYFIFLLTTRAGGVGINLYTADTVIIFDPDFNPHQDLQAIARSYRYGQKKTCLVFKLMVKDSAEERIIQIGKKKLVLDHLIVQKMDDDEDNGGEDFKSILTYGAQALSSSDEGSRDITYTEQDVDNLIEKTRREAVQEKSGEGGLSFSFAKVWAANKDELEEIVEEDQTDSWAQALQKLNQQRQEDHNRQIAESGRGVRRKAADIAKTKIHNSNGLRQFPNVQQASRSPSASEYSDVGGDSDHGSDHGDDNFVEVEEKWTKNLLLPIQNTVQPTLSDCGLCGQRHHGGSCAMVAHSENLAEYREMLIFHADDEPWEERCAAVQAIEQILIKRRHIHLIAGQPLHPLSKSVPVPPPPKRIKNAQHETSKEKSTPSQTSMPPSPCVLCHSNTPHHYNDCSVIRAGSKSIAKAIREMESQGDGALIGTINMLRNLLSKAKSREKTTGTNT